MSKAAEMAKVSAKGSFHLLWGLVISTVISAIGTILLARLLGSDLYGLHKDVIDVAMCGFDYDLLTKTDFTYFNAVYYAPLQLAIEKGIRKMYYRFKAEKVKIDRGCKPEKTYSFVKCHNDFMRAVINNAAKNPPYSYLKKRLLMESL